MYDPATRFVRFGEYLLDRADERLIGPEGPVHIGNKAFRVLSLLTRTNGRLLTKDELFQTVWDGTTVSESALTSVIKELRRALSDDRRAPSYINNVYGRGYRFLTDVHAVEDSLHPADVSVHPRDAERRLITAVAVDLAGAARLSAEVDPENLANLMARYREAVARCISTAGGSVVQTVGDHIFACFGWPETREDAAESAIHAGFLILAEVRRLVAQDQPWQARIGIATGIVVVGCAGGGFGDLALDGVAPTIAMELRRLAAPDTIAIADSTHRLIGALFVCAPLAEAPDGGATAISAWRPLHATPNVNRFQAVRHANHPFVGRTHELSLLIDRWRTAAAGEARAVVILGEAGIGKSRLVDALGKHIAEEPHGTIIWQCSPYHQAKPLYPAIEHLAHMATIEQTDAPSEQFRKLTTLLNAGNGSDAFAPEHQFAALFAHLLSIPPEGGFSLPIMPPNEARAATIAALVAWLHCLAKAQPLLFVVEDAHWSDATTQALLTLIVNALSDTPLMVVITARPEFVSPWSGRAEVGAIGLDRMNDRDCATLAREIVGADEARNNMVEEVVARSDGNPLYVEELSAAVVEIRTVTASSVPDSLQSSLMARLDRLGDAKRVAQLCAVLGRRFARPLLEKLADMPSSTLDAALLRLIAHDVIRPIGDAAGGRYAFKHALVRDAAYESLLLSARRRLHEACGRCLEMHFPDTARAEPELLARHFSLAGVVKAAGIYAERAGDLATAACAFQEAIESYVEAVRHIDAQPADVERDRRRLGVLLKLGPAIAMYRGAQDLELRAIYRSAEALSRSVEDDPARFKAVWGLWYNSNISRELDEAGAFAQQLVDIAERTNDEELRLEAIHCRWSSALFSGNYSGCLADARQGTRLYDRNRHHQLGLVFGGHDPGVCAFGCLGQAQVYASEVDNGFASVERAISLAEELDHPGSLAHGLLMGLIVGTVARRIEPLRACVQRTLDLARRYKLPPQEAMGNYHLAWIEAEIGDRKTGLSEMAALYDRVTAIGPITLLYNVMYVDQLLRAGRAQDGLSAAEAALAKLRFPDRGLVLSELLRLRGESLFALGRGNEGRSELIRAETMARRDGAELFRLRAADSLVRVEVGLGKP